jgi:hypothetical protein
LTSSKLTQSVRQRAKAADEKSSAEPTAWRIREIPVMRHELRRVSEANIQNKMRIRLADAMTRSGALPRRVLERTRHG